MTRRSACLAALALTAGTACAHGQLVFEWTKGPGFLALEGTDPAKATAMYAAATSAGAVFSSLFSDPVTLKYTLEYSPATTPPGVLAFADSIFTAVPFPSVKGALIADATSASAFTSLGGLPGGPFVPMFRNDTAGLTFPEKEPFLDPTPFSPNNTVIDMCVSNQKALGLLPGAAGGAGTDAKIVISGAAFDFDYTNGIGDDTFDFPGVMLHEIAHAMGFLSGTDTMAIHLGSPPAAVDGLAMLTTLDRFRYSPLSLTFGARDISLPLPGATGDAAVRFFSIDGGATILDYFSTGDGPFGFGDGEQGGHWKTDGIFGLLDPTLAIEYNLSAAWLAMLSASRPDIVALDAIGWTLVPAPGASGLFVLGALVAVRRRRAAA